MNLSEKAFVIINPNAGHKKGLRDWQVIASLLNRQGIIFKNAFTAGTSDATEFARNAVERGCRHFITVGGDGTFNEVANGVLLQKIVPSAEILLSMIPVGTGNDWCRMYHLPDDYDGIIRVIKNGEYVFQDTGKVTFSTKEGRKERCFVNIAGMGMDARVVFDTNRRKEKGRGGKMAYLLSLISAMFSYSSCNVRIKIDGTIALNGQLYSANVGICRYSGGGMQQVPFAVPDDGLFDVTIIRKVSKMKVALNVKGLYDGSFIKLKEVSTHRATSVVVESDDPILLEADGESLGSPPFEFTILPGALRINVPSPMPHTVYHAPLSTCQ